MHMYHVTAVKPVGEALRSDAVAAITDALEMPVDLFVYSPNEFEAMKKGFFVGRAVKEGITVCER